MFLLLSQFHLSLRAREMLALTVEVEKVYCIAIFVNTHKQTSVVNSLALCPSEAGTLNIDLRSSSVEA